MSYRDALCLRYAVKTNTDDIQLLVWTKAPESGEYTIATAEKVLNAASYANIGGVRHLIFELTGITAKQMTDVFYTRVYCNAGGVDYYSETNRYSIIDHVYKLRNDPSTLSAEINAVSKMLEYGAAVQQMLIRFSFSFSWSRSAAFASSAR